MSVATSFNAIEYRASLQGRLAGLSSLYMRCFATWCLRAIIDSWSDLFSRCVSESDMQFVYDSVELFWEHVLAQSEPSPERISAIRDHCGRIGLDSCDPLPRILLIETLGALLAVVEVFVDDNLQKCALVADHAINCVDAQISERAGRSPKGDLSRVPEIAAELRVQDRMLCYLEGSPVLSKEDIRRFRGSETGTQEVL